MKAFEMHYTVKGFLTNFKAIVEAETIEDAEKQLKEDVKNVRHPDTNKPLQVKEIFLTIQL